MINDTICAVSTPPGTGGIAVIRISGPEAIEVAQKLWHGKHLASVESHTVHLGTLHTLESDDDLLDQGVATVFRGPRSFTGEDVVELSVHGSPYLQSELIRQLSKAGARIAMPGEFTRRAFVAGRFDLAEAEAVADLIASTSKTAHRLAMSQMRGDLSAELTRLRESLIELASLLELELDFSEEQVEFASRKELLRQTDVCLNILGELQRSYISAATLREGLPVALIGPTNAGKSSLLNALSSSNRAIVSDIPGTTRDIIDTLIDIDGTLFRLIDTAGLRVTDDPVEAIGIDRARQAAATAHVILLLTDPLTDETVERTAERYNEAKALAGDQSTIIPVLTKSDIADDGCIALWKERLAAQGIPAPIVVSTEAEHRHTLQPLRKAILKTVPFAEGAPDQVILTNARHLRQIELATEALQSTREGLKQDIPADLVAQDLRAALHHLGEITGTISAPDLLSTIFSRFCIGK